ncbi:hypothetical protein [Erythrobacter neustonensis]|uniref:Uncharacterized protein n=1 Tax=Erythrobacter neustonensis TaxID=1112 RepID=A0A192D638_9SPHN|nr:hypothetical protein [Erythrobacter neustonensis]ANK13234.1 hypothetical protein A9D12_10100 [Erythrobacter neustonensis]
MNNASQPPERLGGDLLDKALSRALFVITVLVLPTIVPLVWSMNNGANIPFITARYFLTQDLPVLIGLVIAFMGLRAWRADNRLALRLNRFLAAALRVNPALLALGAAGVCAAGVWLVFGRFALSMDEFWAQADGVVLANGAGLVQIPAEWRDYAQALQPIFARITPDGWWASEYLPGNAALQYLGGPLASPLLTGFAVLVAADLARRLLPEAPYAPALCALLMVSSSQLLITGMTPYAMSAHLALNLGWLWLFLRSDWRAQCAAAAVPLLAVGLHQVVFFPLFAAPFLLNAWLEKRRAAAALQAFAIAASFLIWSAYDSILYNALGVAAVTTSGGGTGTGTALLLSRFLVLVADFNPGNFTLMMLNLIRFVTWQNALLLPLMLIAVAGFARMAGVWRAMLGAIALTVGFLVVILAFQGHGWGYRYLHGHLGSACLLATYGFVRLSDQPQGYARARAMVGAALAVSLLLVPIRAWQAYAFAAPYRAADAWISARDVDVVLIDAPQHIYAVDLIRNDPLLRNRPKRMAAGLLDDAQLAALCRRYKVALFTDAEAARFGLHAVPSDDAPRIIPAGCTPSPR